MFIAVHKRLGRGSIITWSNRRSLLGAVKLIGSTMKHNVLSFWQHDIWSWILLWSAMFRKHTRMSSPAWNVSQLLWHIVRYLTRLPMRCVRLYLQTRVAVWLITHQCYTDTNPFRRRIRQSVLYTQTMHPSKDEFPYKPGKQGLFKICYTIVSSQWLKAYNISPKYYYQPKRHRR